MLLSFGRLSFDALDNLSSKLQQITIPFSILHDPDDRATRFSGSERLFKLSPSLDKQLIPMVGCKHLLRVNAFEELYEHLSEWTSARVDQWIVLLCLNTLYNKITTAPTWNSWASWGWECLSANSTPLAPPPHCNSRCWSSTSSFRSHYGSCTTCLAYSSNSARNCCQTYE